MKLLSSLIFGCAILFCNQLSAQHLRPGFDKSEFLELLKLGARATANSEYYDTLPAPQHSKMLYQSPAIGLDNLWQLWIRDDSVAVLNVRGTTTTAVSFLANLYAAMVPAKGALHLEKDFDFQYNLSDDSKAAVHVGFLISAAFLSRDMLPRIDSLYKKGIREFIIAGHSQGGAITYLLTSYLENLKAENKLPADIKFKTCASASPKPGNLYYAYTFENLTRNGWAYNVVSNVDWVPEVPLTVQTIHDFNMVNPFAHAKSLIKKQKFPKNLALKHIYNRMTKPSLKAQKRYENFLGKMISKQIKKTLPDFTPPAYYKSSNYVRTGNTIVLYADKNYYEKYPQNGNDVWVNHFQGPYIYLTEKLPE